MIQKQSVDLKSVEFFRHNEQRIKNLKLPSKPEGKKVRSHTFLWGFKCFGTYKMKKKQNRKSFTRRQKDNSDAKNLSSGYTCFPKEIYLHARTRITEWFLDWIGLIGINFNVK